MTNEECQMTKETRMTTNQPKPAAMPFADGVTGQTFVIRRSSFRH